MGYINDEVTLNGYQEDAARTIGDLKCDHHGLSVCALGIAGEGGEVADLIKKHIGHGHPLDKEKVIKELGDVLWYVAILADLIGVGLEQVAVANIAKLRARYPDGFSHDASRNRAIEK